MASEPVADAKPTEAVAPGPAPGLRIAAPVAAAVVLVDQLTKIWAVERLGDGSTIDLFWTARFNLVRNKGSAFSLGTSVTPVVAVLALSIAVAIVVVARRITDRTTAVVLGVVLGGAIGNLLDRLLRADGFLDGAVIDFIDFQWWPVFNVADCAIVVGGFVLALVWRDGRQ